jgi:hypothetical protein
MKGWQIDGNESRANEIDGAVDSAVLKLTALDLGPVSRVAQES